MIQHLNNKLLLTALRFVVEENKACDNAYHNTYHIFNVTKNAAEAANYYNLDSITETTLLLAAMFHDINHSGGWLSDEDNINIAFQDFGNFYEKHTNLFDDFMISYEKVCNLIEITEYPHKREPKTIEEKIIIDSDLSCYYSDNWYLSVIEGFLIKEQKLTYEEAIKTQINFIENVKFHTTYFNKKHVENKEIILYQLKKLQ